MSSYMISYSFTTFIVSLTSTKLLHLFSNASSFPAAVFVLCLPAFLVPDILLITLIWLLLRQGHDFVSYLSFSLGCILSLVTFGAASCQLSFFYRTGGEIDWSDAAFAFNEEGRKVLVSEGVSTLSCAFVLLVLSWMLRIRLYRSLSSALTAGAILFRSAFQWLVTGMTRKKSSKGEIKGFLLPTHETETDSGFDSDSESDEPGRGRNANADARRTCAMQRSHFIPSALAFLIIVGLLAIPTLLDSERPYGRMFSTLPLTLLSSFTSDTVVCTSTSWPLPELVDKQNWEPPHGDFKGWAPGAENDIVRQYRIRRPDWLPSVPLSGFERWGWDGTPVDSDFDGNTVNIGGAKCLDPSDLDPYYNPVNDPTKITNLDEPMLGPLRKALHQQSIKIKHIVLIMMESVRQELFPLQQGSDIHDTIMKSHHESDHERVNELLSRLTPNAERITGIKGWGANRNGTAPRSAHAEWVDDSRDDFGGINVEGALTTSTVSTKSLAAIHCGTWPLPVDMFEEAETSPYQPCIPEILDLFNKIKQDDSSDDFREQPWSSAFFQASTDDYDRQGRFDHNIGFKHVVNRKLIQQDGRWDPNLTEVNYFGYSETTLKKYIDDYITEVKESNQRMFLSHFTSTTHHPWSTPRDFDTSQYMGSAHELLQSHKDLNNYLNTIRFADSWIGQLMQIFHEHGISNETLVIFVGDHGQAFREDSLKAGTYDNPHISNQRIPITFRHPLLPRVHHRVNATSLSIVPTLLDLLINTDSLNPSEAAAAADLMQDYEGQSLIRPFKTSKKGRRAWNFGVVNPGGRILTVTSSDTPWRLILPVDKKKKKTEYIFSDIGNDAMELNRVQLWSLRSLKSAVRGRYGDEAAKWLAEAEKVAQWWIDERRRLWRYEPS